MLSLFNSIDKEVLNRTLLKALIFLFLLLFFTLIVNEVFFKAWFQGWISFIAILVLFVLITGSYALLKSTDQNKKNKPDSMSKFFFWGIRVIIFILLFLGALGTVMVFETYPGKEAVFYAVGLGIITLWACVFLAYFIWAVYYYNVNLGLTDEEWNKIYQAKEDKRQGNFYNQDDINAEPEYNPYKDETFGMPNGTVRGMIAFSLLFGAISLLVVSFGMTNEIDPNSLFWDQYEFFKTAFLMMIAFYFGSRSLQYLRGNGAPKPVGKESGKNGSTPPSDPASLKDTITKEMKMSPAFGDEDPMKSEKESTLDSKKPEVKEDFSIVDPMKGQS